MQHFHVAPWALFDDDGTDVLLVDAWEAPASTLLVTERALLLDLLDRLHRAADSGVGTNVSDHEALLLQELLDRGILHGGPTCGPGQRVVEGPSQLFLGQLVVELAASDDPVGLAPALEGLLGDLLAAEMGVTGVVFRVGGLGASVPWDRYGHLAERIDAFVRARVRDLLTARGIDPSASESPEPSEDLSPRRDVWTSWELSAPLTTVDERAMAFFDAFGGSRCLIEDCSELGGPFAQTWMLDQQVHAARDLAEEGYECFVSVPTRLDYDVLDRVGRWTEEGLCSGVRMQPLIARGASPGEPPAAWTDADVERAVDVMACLSRGLRPLLHQCHPWRAQLMASVVPVHGTLAWNKKESVIHLGADGRWSRSSAHAALGLVESLEDLFPSIYGTGSERWRGSRFSPLVDEDDVPDCGACGFAALCDKYWTPDFDALQAIGARDAARAAARFECETRKLTLSALLDELRAEAHLQASRPAAGERTIFHFDRKVVELSLEPSGV